MPLRHSIRVCAMANGPHGLSAHCQTVHVSTGGMVGCSPGGSTASLLWAAAS